MRKPEKQDTETVWFWDTYTSGYSLKDVIARLPREIKLEDVNVTYNAYEGKTSFTYTRLVPNAFYETEMKRYEEYRSKRIVELQDELDKLKEEDE